MISRKRSSAENNKNMDTIIGEGIIFEDVLLKGEGVMRIDGKLSGKINISGHITLGETGSIVGDVHTDSALFAGKYQGNLNVRGVLHITSTAVITGKVEVGNIIIDEGGKVSGTLNVTNGEMHEIAASNNVKLTTGEEQLT